MISIEDFDPEDAEVDTFMYVFYPSTGKGRDVADTSKIKDPTLRDTDGLLYLAGANGVFVVYFDGKKPNIVHPNAVKPTSVGNSAAITTAKTVDEFKNAVLAKYPNAQFRVESHTMHEDNIIVILGNRRSRCSMVYNKETGTKNPDYSVGIPE